MKRLKMEKCWELKLEINITYIMKSLNSNHYKKIWNEEIFFWQVQLVTTIIPLLLRNFFIVIV